MHTFDHETEIPDMTAAGFSMGAHFRVLPGPAQVAMHMPYPHDHWSHRPCSPHGVTRPVPDVLWDGGVWGSPYDLTPAV